jgi:hypothetical protein
VDHAVNDGVLLYIRKQIEELNKRDIALKLRERDLENYAKKHNLTMEDTGFKKR